jgi:lauroyl/myristoyl acyltransferase
LLSFDLLGALRRGEIVSIQGDRVMGDVATVEGRMFGARVRIPSGPFTLAQIAEAPVYPLFIVRAGHRRYRIIVRDPILVQRSSADREQDIAPAVAQWCNVLEQIVSASWHQWFAFAPIFIRDGRA